jgi:hypothetical protein
LRKADKGRTKFLAEATLTNPSTGLADCCARAASGHATADAVAALMNSRRRIVTPDAEETISYQLNRVVWKGRCPL